MRSEYGHIDDAFRDKLKDIEVSAPIDAWEGISAQIAKPKGRFVWYKIAASVAAIAVIGSLFWMINSNDEVLDNKITEEINSADFEQIDSRSELINREESEPIIKQVIDDNSAGVVQEEGKNTSTYLAKVNAAEMLPALNNIESGNNSNGITQRIKLLNPLKITINNISRDFNAIVKSESTFAKNDLKVIDEPEIDLLMAYNTADEIIQDSEKSKWIIGGDFTPLYSYRNIAKSEANYNAAYYNKLENPILTYTGGLNMEYKASNRLSVQTGVYYTSMGQSLDYMTVYSNEAYNMVPDEYKDRLLNAYELDNSAGAIRLNTSYIIVDEIAARVNYLSSNKGFINTADPVFQDMNAEIQQKFQYIEVPLLLRYKLIDRLIDFNLVGGVGANFLIGNDVVLTHGNSQEIIGETKGVDAVNYTGSFGFGIEYPLFKKLNFRLEPSIKYYLNSINANSEVESHPYSIGVYTGFSFTF